MDNVHLHEKHVLYSMVFVYSYNQCLCIANLCCTDMQMLSFVADRAIYFHVYANSKQFLAPYLSIDSPSNHLLSSGCASQ